MSHGHSCGKGSVERAACRAGTVNNSNTGIRIARDVGLFILEDNGVFFTGHDLQTFNTPATYAWCCLEENWNIDEITAGYAEAFGVSAEEASRYIADLLHRWQVLGYLAGVDVPAPGEIDFTTALGRLLSNSALRNAFANNPEATVRRLAVRAQDRKALLSLEPGTLERQAQMLKAKIEAFRPTVRPRHNAATASALDRLQSKPSTLPARTHHYRLLDTVLRLECDSAMLAEQLHPVLKPLETTPHATVDSVLSICEQAHGYILREDGRPFACCSPENLVPMMLTSLHDIALDACNCLLRVQAGAVATNGQCVLFPATKWQDRTALVAALSASGFNYLSDGVSPLITPSLHTRAMVVPPAVRNEDAATLCRYYPDLPGLPCYRDEEGMEIRFLSPPAGSADRNADFPVRWIIFPGCVPGGEAALQPVSKTDALQRLLQCAVLPRPLDKQDAEDLVHWMRQVDCYDLSFSTLSEAVEIITSLCH